MVRIAVDTNVLVYAEGLERVPADQPKIATSRSLIRSLSLSGETWFAPAQVLAELHSVLVRRGGRTPRQATIVTRQLGELCSVVPTSTTVLDVAFGLAADNGFQIYDAVIVGASAEAGCDLLLSEDLHDGFVWRGVTVVNPYGPNPDVRLAGLFAGPA